MLHSRQSGDESGAPRPSEGAAGRLAAAAHAVAAPHARSRPPPSRRSLCQARGLTDFISDLRNCSGPEQERKRVEKEMAHIRSKFTSESNMNGARHAAAAVRKT